MRRSLIPILLVAAGCSRPIDFLATPDLGEARSALVWLQSDRERTITATPVDELEIAVPDPESALSLTVVGLSEPLEALGLSPGVLPVDPPQPARPLTEVQKTEILRAVHDGGWSAWESTALPQELGEVQLPRRGCLALIDETKETLRGASVAMAEPLDDERLLVVYGARAMIWSTREGVLEENRLSVPMESGLRLEERFYLGEASFGSSIYRLDPTTLEITFTASTSEMRSRPFHSMRWMDGRTTAAGDVLTLLNRNGLVIRYDADGYRVLDEINVVSTGIDTATIIMVSETEALIGADHNLDVYRVTPSAVVSDFEGPIETKGFGALAEIDGLGPIAIELSTGAVYARDDRGAWNVFWEVPFEPRITLPLGPNHFLVSDELGNLSEFHPVHGANCPRHLSLAMAYPQALVRMGPDIYGVGVGASGVVEIALLLRVP